MTARAVILCYSVVLRTWRLRRLSFLLVIASKAGAIALALEKKRVTGQLAAKAERAALWIVPSADGAAPVPPPPMTWSSL